MVRDQSTTSDFTGKHLSSIINQTTLDEIKELAGEDAEPFLRELIEQYFADAVQLLAEIETAIAQHHAAQLNFKAHTLKSMSLNVGAIALVAPCQALETMGEVGILEKSAEQLVQAQLAYEQVKVALQLEIQGDRRE